MRSSLFILLLAFFSLAPARNPGPDDIPEWARQGKFRFTRLDGGPLEVRKTTRSAWGMHFNEAQKEVLANLYSKYADRTVDLLAQAGINWVWLTWSVGFSDSEEAEQRAQCKTMAARLRARGIRSAAYMCAVSIFWETMFRDHPRSVRWILFDKEGVPFRYSGGRDPLRFIGDVGNPEWLEYQKRRVGAIADAGIDSIFFDNTAFPGWNDSARLESFFAEIRRYLREEKKSPLVLFTNYGLHPEGVVLNRNMDVVFNEGWQEPGAWGEEWQVANIRRMKYVRGAIPDWKPMMSEYSIFRSGNRATTWLSPRSQKLGIAEAAAFGSAYCWDQEGPFDGALMANDPAAMASWKAIGEYNGFLKEHESLYAGARSAAPVAVLVSNRRGSFTWNREAPPLFDRLARGSVLHDLRLPGSLNEDVLSAYRGVVVPPGVELNAAESALLDRFRTRGGKVLAGSESVEQVRALAGDAVSLSVSSESNVLGNLTRLPNGRYALHLLNYAQQPARNVRVRVRLDSAASPRLLTPDAATRGFKAAAQGPAVEFTLESLDTYAVVAFE